MKTKIFPIVTFCSLLLLLLFSGTVDRALAQDWDASLYRPEPVIMWSGPLADIPDGWRLCNGTKGMPDLRDRFVQCAIDFPGVGEVGGSHLLQLDLSNLPAHAHDFTTSENGGHFHDGTDRCCNGYTYEPSGWSSCNGTEPVHTFMGLNSNPGGLHSHSGMTDLAGIGASFDNRPAYYRLAFITRPRPPIKGKSPGIPAALGSIVLWSDGSTTPPAGWLICDGTNGTPDLRGRFVLGVQEGQDPGETGGSDYVQLSEDNLPPHDHNFQTGQSWMHTHYYEDLVIETKSMTYGGLISYSDIVTSNTDSEIKLTDLAGNHYHTGITDYSGESAAVDNRPFYRSLPYIMLKSTEQPPTAPIPVGAIAFWYGGRANMPRGWQLCDGTNGTPDLRDRFILGGETSVQEGGQNQVYLALNQMPGHAHPLTTNATGEHAHEYYDHWRTAVFAWATGWSWTTYCGAPSYTEVSNYFYQAGEHYHTGTTDYVGNSAPYDNRPAYYKAALIMRMY